MGKLARIPGNHGAPDLDAADVRAIQRLLPRYYAFLSYSHRDKELADWLHKELEKFRVPRALVGRLIPGLVHLCLAIPPHGRVHVSGLVAISRSIAQGVLDDPTFFEEGEAP